MSVNPPRTRTLPLNALRAFEAAARHESFVAAAAELGVTPGAVAQQIRKLEAWLGAEIFERNARGVRLAHDRKLVAAEISRNLEDIASSARKLGNLIGARTVHLAALPAVAQLWLRPRLEAVAKRLDTSSISVTAQEEPPLLETELFDAAVFFLRDAHHVDGKIIPIERDVIVPVCRPEIAARLSHPTDLAGVTLLHDGTWRSDWGAWLHAAAGPTSIAAGGSVYSLYSMALDAALAGEGVLIGHLPLVRDLLTAGKLVKPFAQEVSLDATLSILLPSTVGADGEALAAAILSARSN